jgi:hypothetical protein
MGLRMTRALLPPTLRALPWRAFTACGALGLGLVAVPLMASLEVGPGMLVGLLRVAALCGALAVAFALDDPARETTAAVPVPRARRQALRAVLVLAPLCAWWAAVLAVARALSPGLPLAAVSLEAAGLWALALCMAGAALRFTGAAEPGAAVAGVVLAVFVAAQVIPLRHYAPFVPPGDSRWREAHRLWAVVGGAAVVIWAACGPEPLWPPRRQRWPRRSSRARRRRLTVTGSWARARGSSRRALRSWK